MRALGIDPGSTVTGFGVVEQTATGYRHVDSGVVRTRPTQPLSERLATIYGGILRIIDETRPDEVAIEEVFVARNSRAALRHESGPLLALNSKRQGQPRLPLVCL